MCVRGEHAPSHEEAGRPPTPAAAAGRPTTPACDWQKLSDRNKGGWRWWWGTSKRVGQTKNSPFTKKARNFFPETDIKLL